MRRRASFTFIFTFTLVALTVDANAGLLNLNFAVTADDLPGTVEGMFSGDTGADNVLLGTEVDSFMVAFTANPASGFTSFNLSVPGDLFRGFSYNAVTDEFRFRVEPFSATFPVISYTSSSQLFFFDDPTGKLYRSSDPKHTVTEKVPLPSTLALFSLGLLAMRRRMTA